MSNFKIFDSTVKFQNFWLNCLDFTINFTV